MSSSLKARTLTAIVGIPFLFCVIFFFPQFNHLFFSIVVVFVTTCGTWELKNNLIKKRIDTPFTAYLGCLLPVIEIIRLHFCPEVELTIFALAAFVALSFLVEALNGEKDNFESSILRIGATVFNIVYPGLFMVYGVRLCFLPSPRAMIFTFLACVLGSDTMAYIVGHLFGKNNKGYVKCSPNKSIAGFVGGTVVIALIGLLIVVLNPNLLPFTPLGAFVLFFFTSVFGTAGDLFESMLKRSCGVKDAGVMIPGRGGMLDCIDSISVACPVFVLGVELILL